jgi:hypothetical protein
MANVSRFSLFYFIYLFELIFDLRIAQALYFFIVCRGIGRDLCSSFLDICLDLTSPVPHLSQSISIVNLYR